MTSAFTVDDLVLSLNGNHIGDDAINLKALQAQLAETLFSHTVNSNGQQVPRRNSEVSQLCTTPTMRTSGSTFAFGDPQPTARPFLALKTDSFAPQIDEDLDDEAMVEDILMDCSSPMPISPLYGANPRKASLSSNQMPMNTPLIPHHPLPPPSDSLFTTCDPFYMQTAQSQTKTSSTSVFAQGGIPCHQSPFLRGQQFQMSSFGKRESLGSHSTYPQNHAAHPTPPTLMASAFDR